MTDAADKAREIVNKYLLDVAMPVGKLMHIESAILSAIESAVQAERERAGKLVEVADRMRDVFEGVSHFNPDHGAECDYCNKGKIITTYSEARSAYEVQP